MYKILVIASKGGTGKSMITASLRDALGDAQIVDLDPQRTISISAEESGRPLPIDPKQASAKYLIYDTPPYHDESIKSQLKSFDQIVIPVKSGLSDLIALKAIYDDVVDAKMTKKTMLVFNEVRKPINNTHKEIVELFKHSYPLLRVANTQLSTLLAFNRVLAEPLNGKALIQIKSLIKEFYFMQ